MVERGLLKRQRPSQSRLPVTKWSETTIRSALRDAPVSSRWRWSSARALRNCGRAGPGRAGNDVPRRRVLGVPRPPGPPPDARLGDVSSPRGGSGLPGPSLVLVGVRLGCRRRRTGEAKGGCGRGSPSPRWQVPPANRSLYDPPREATSETRPDWPRPSAASASAGTPGAASPRRRQGRPPPRPRRWGTRRSHGTRRPGQMVTIGPYPHRTEGARVRLVGSRARGSG
jgi:hypothetical protein